MKNLILLITCIYFLILFYGCTDTKTSNIESSNECSNIGSYDTISVPFQYYYNEILFEAEINHSKTLYFLLDTGCSILSINERTARELGLETGPAVDDGNSYIGEETLMVAPVKEVCFTVQKASMNFTDNISVHSFETIEAVMGHQIDGVIGNHLFERYVIEIDYEKKVFKMHDPIKFRYSGKESAIPITIDRIPYLEASLVLPDKNEIDGVFMVDTGNAGNISLTTPFCQGNDMFGKIKKTIPAIGVGGAGKSRNRTGRVKGLSIGTFDINEPIVTLSSDEKGGMTREDISGIIGNEIWSRFKLIFDYSRRQLILEPSKSIQSPMESDMSGMFLYAGGNHFDQINVYDIIPGSPADEAGIKAGDRIKSIDNVEAGKYSIDRIIDILKENGKRYHLEIIRNENVFSTEILLRRLI